LGCSDIRESADGGGGSCVKVRRGVHAASSYI